MSSNNGKLKSSVGKIFITLCASGDVDGLNDFTQRNPTVINHCNPESGESGIYYAIRNLKSNTTKYLLNKGFKINAAKVRSLISSTWRGSIESYLFLKEFGLSLYNPKEETTIPIDNDKDYRSWLFTTYTEYCFTNHNLRKIVSFIEIENRLTHNSILDILSRYEKRTNFNKKNPTYISNIRELKLMALLHED